MSSPLVTAGLALVLAACSSSSDSSREAAAADSLQALAANPPFIGAWWRLASLGGEAPVEGVRPVLLFTEVPAERDMFDRPYADSLADWRIVNGENGVGHLHAPYRRTGDALRFADTYEYTRASTEAEIEQARRLADALALVRHFRKDGPRLALLDDRRDTLATFTADPPRPPGPLDDIEWVLTAIDGRPAPDSTRATLTFTSNRIGPGPDDGFDQYGGYSGCNWYGGGYRLTEEGDGRFRLATSGPPMSTARGCHPRATDVEHAVQRALYRTAHLRATSDRLALFDSSGTERLSFRRHEPYAVDLRALRTGSWSFSSSANPYAPDASGAVVTFADSTFEAASGCTRLRGTYHIDGDNLYFPMMEGDEDDCTDAERQTHRPIPLSSGKLAVSPKRLVLYDENGLETVYTR